jgi:tRNA dimethylallyltransferase
MLDRLSTQLGLTPDCAKQLDYIALLGPTGSGKTACALALARAYPDCFEVVSMDSVQVYRGCDIGSAKVSQEIQAEIKHHLLDICDVDERYTAARFAKDCALSVRSIRQRGKTALLVGGTFLYAEAFMQGLSPIGSTSDNARAQVAPIMQRGVEQAWQHLMTLDPALAARLEPRDTCRIERGLLVYYSTGRPLSHWHKQPPVPVHAFRGTSLMIMPRCREQLKITLAQRFDQMLTDGLVAEVEMLWQKFPHLTMDYPSVRAIGYRQVSAYLHQQCDYTQMRDAAVVATRRYLKRQLTWLRHRLAVHRYCMSDTKWSDFW